MTKFKNIRFPLSAPSNYGMAVFIFAFALAVRLLILPVEAGLAYLTFYPATIICFYICGIRPGFLFVVLSTITGFYIFFPPFWSFSPSLRGYVSVVAFLLYSWIVAEVVRRYYQNQIGYEALLEDQTDFICRFLVDGRILYVNEAYCRYFGLSRDKLVGHHWHPVVYEDDIPAINQKLSVLSPQMPVVVVENRVYAHDGELHWAQFVNHGFFNESGELTEIQSVGRDITERKQLEERLTQSSRELEDIYDHAPCGYHSLGIDGTVLRINETELNWLGCKREDIVGKRKMSEFFTEASQEKFKQNFSEFLRKGYIKDMRFELAGSGPVRNIMVSATAVKGPDGEFLMSRSVVYDITELKQTEDRLRQLTLEQTAMLENELVGIMKIRNRKILWANKGMERISGYLKSELEGADTRILYPDDQSYQSLGGAAYPILFSKGTYRTQIEWVKKSGERFWADLSGAMLEDGNDKSSLWMLVDFTAIKEQEQLVKHIAYHDVLTGLPNRLLFSDRLKQALALAERTEQMLAVCFLDLDGFKPINDHYGHAAGDKVLIEISDRMRNAIRSIDTVSRFGGDEFVLLLTSLTHESEYQVILQRVVDEIKKPLQLDGGASVHVTASIGVSLYPSDSMDQDILIRYADEAMYEAKAAGRNITIHYQTIKPKN